METKKGKGKKILLAEDDKFISKAYSAGLSHAGFEIIVAFDGEEAIEKTRSAKPDMILLDLMMPKKNGFEVLKEIKADENLKSIPVIIISNLGQEADMEQGKKLGATDYLIKSNLAMWEVIEKIKIHLEK